MPGISGRRSSGGTSTNQDYLDRIGDALPSVRVQEMQFGMWNWIWDLGGELDVGSGRGTSLKRRSSTFRLGGRGIQMKTINSINSPISIPSLEYERGSQR